MNGRISLKLSSPRIGRDAFRKLHRLCLAGCFALTLPACIELESSPYDTSNGGLLGALITILGSAATGPGVFLAFTDATHYFQSTGDGKWERVDFTGATGSVREVKHFGGQTLWGLDANATNNIVRSDDFGKTWTSVSVGPIALATLDICGTTIFSTFVNGPNYRAAYSNDSGTTWSLSDIQAGTFTTQDALCISDSTLLSAKNNTPPVQRSTDGGASWVAGGALTGIPQIRIANRTGTAEILVIKTNTFPESSLSTNGAVSYAAADTAAFVSHTWGGAITADASSYYVAMRNNTSCDLFTNPTGAAGNYTTIPTVCTASTNMTHAAVGDNTVLFGGTDGGAAPRLFRYNTITGTTFQETLPTTASTTLTDIVFFP